VGKETGMKRLHLDGVEDWREYDFGGRVYRIDNPKSVYIGTTTHRVVDQDDIAHCVPAPGFNGCALRWKGEVVA